MFAPHRGPTREDTEVPIHPRTQVQQASADKGDPVELMGLAAAPRMRVFRTSQSQPEEVHKAVALVVRQRSTPPPEASWDREVSQVRGEFQRREAAWVVLAEESLRGRAAYRDSPEREGPRQERGARLRAPAAPQAPAAVLAPEECQGQVAFLAQEARRIARPAALARPRTPVRRGCTPALQGPNSACRTAISPRQCPAARLNRALARPSLSSRNVTARARVPLQRPRHARPTRQAQDPTAPATRLTSYATAHV